MRCLAIPTTYTCTRARKSMPCALNSQFLDTIRDTDPTSSWGGCCRGVGADWGADIRQRGWLLGVGGKSYLKQIRAAKCGGNCWVVSVIAPRFGTSER